MVEAAVKLLDAEENPVRQALSSMMEAKDVIADNDVIYLPPFYYAENGSAKRLQTLLSDTSLFNSDVAAEPEAEYGSKAMVLSMTRCSRQQFRKPSILKLWC